MGNFGFMGFPAPPKRGAAKDWARGITPTASVSYTTIGNITDGNDATAGSAAAATMPQYVQIDLGSSRLITKTRMLFVDTAHCSKDGSLQGSDDGTAWTTVLSWSGITTLDRTLYPNYIARYWRLNTTAPGTASNGINIDTWTLEA